MDRVAVALGSNVGDRRAHLDFAAAVAAWARKLVGDFPIGVRVGFDGDGHGRGLTIAETVEIARQLAPHAAYISVSGGNYSGMGDGFDGGLQAADEDGFHGGAGAVAGEQAEHGGQGPQAAAQL